MINIVIADTSIRGFVVVGFVKYAGGKNGIDEGAKKHFNHIVSDVNNRFHTLNIGLLLLGATNDIVQSALGCLSHLA